MAAPAHGLTCVAGDLCGVSALLVHVGWVHLGYWSFLDNSVLKRWAHKGCLLVRPGESFRLAERAVAHRCPHAVAGAVRQRSPGWRTHGTKHRKHLLCVCVSVCARSAPPAQGLLPLSDVSVAGVVTGVKLYRGSQKCNLELHRPPPPAFGIKDCWNVYTRANSIIFGNSWIILVTFLNKKKKLARGRHLAWKILACVVQARQKL